MEIIKEVTIETLRKIVREKKIFCFGAGDLGFKCCNSLSIYGFGDKIGGFIDNNILKQGGKISIFDDTYDIISFEQFCNSYNNCIIVICCSAVRDVLEQIENAFKEKNIEIVLWHLILSKAFSETVYNGNLRLCREAVIPKVINYCWFGKSRMPVRLVKCIDSWKKYCPDYEIKCWNENNYDVTKNRYMYEAYKAKKYAFVPDYARLDIIFNNGGIYLDTDVEMIKNYDDLLYQDGFCGVIVNQYPALGLGFGARKNLKIIKEMRDYYDDIDFIDVYGNPILIPCDIHQYKVLRMHGYICNNQCQIIEGLTVYPTVIFDGENWYTQTSNIQWCTHSIHRPSASWLSDEMRITMKERDKILQKIK